MTVAPYGTWKSPITSDLAIAGLVRPMFPTTAGERTYWVETRPSEGGRYVLVRHDPGGEPEDVLPETFSVRTLVHEYGGRCHAVARAAGGDTVYFVDFADQRIYRAGPGEAPVAITPEPPAPRAWRYADLVVTPDGRNLLCIRERHEGGEVVNDIASLATDGSEPPRQVTGGHDFYLWPTLDAAGGRLAWVGWDHPRMPWDGTVLYEAPFADGGLAGEARRVAGGEEESVVEPLYDAAGHLHFASDRSGWWNLYADYGGDGEALCPLEGEFAQPAWQCGQRGYGFLADGRLVARWRAGGADHIGLVAGGAAEEVPIPLTAISTLDAGDGRVAVTGGSGSLDSRVASIRIPSGEVTVLRTSRPARLDPSWFSPPSPVHPPLPGGGTTHAYYYAPHNPDYEAPEGELPPLIVSSHGGPTGSASAVLDYDTQFWTSRGFAVVDVDYGGSAGYGRAYRERLKGKWGIVDLDDCVQAALWLADQGLADRRRVLVHGGSAGGYTTLCALTFRGEVFAAGASYFGVADAGALARDTHKFESRYLDGLMGPWPEAQEVYEERSPLFHTDQLRTPMILFQGSEDQVVPPAQAEAMAAALREKGVAFAYLLFEGEQHGFRKAENMKRKLEAELYFYGRVLGFEPADEIEPVEIENAGALAGGGGSSTTGDELPEALAPPTGPSRCRR